MCGPSAGSLCWFEQALSAFHGAPRPVRGLGLLPFSNCVHYDAEPARREEYHRAVAEGMKAGFAVEDGVALHFRARSLERAVSSRPDGRAFLVERRGARVREAALAVEFLGTPPTRAAGRPAEAARRTRASAGPRRGARRRAGRGMSDADAPLPDARRARAADDLRDGRRRLHDGAGEPAAR